MNPYEPTSSTIDSGGRVANVATIENNRPVRRFRKRIIPATISWLVGGLTLLAFPFAIYNNWKYLELDFDENWPWFLLNVAMLATFPAVFCVGLCNVLAGKKWIQGRWVLAIALNAVPGLLMWVLVALEDYLRNWALNSY